MIDYRAAADALFKGPVERIVRRSRRTGSIRKAAPDLPNRRAIGAELRRIETEIGRLTVYHTDPERFFVERSELRAAIGRLAKQLEAR